MLEADSNKKKRKAAKANAGIDGGPELETPPSKKKKNRVAEAGSGNAVAVAEAKPLEHVMLEADSNKKKRKAAKASANLNGDLEAEMPSGKKRKNRLAEGGSGDTVAVDEVKPSEVMAKAHRKKKSRMQAEEAQDDEAVELLAAKTSADLSAAGQKKKHLFTHAASGASTAGVAEESVEDIGRPRKKNRKDAADIQPPAVGKTGKTKSKELASDREKTTPASSAAEPRRSKCLDVADIQSTAGAKMGKKKSKEFSSDREKATPASPAAEPSRSKSFANSEFRLFVSGISRNCDEAVLRKDFEECGEVTNLKLLLDSDGLSRGIAFITYKDEAGFQAALAYDGDAYNGRTLRIKKAEAKGTGRGTSTDMGTKPEGCNSIVLKKLSLDVVSEDLRELFQHCNGGPKHVGLLTDPYTGKSRGTARVDFNSSAGVDEAVKLLGTKLKGQPLVMSYCQPKSW